MAYRRLKACECNVPRSVRVALVHPYFSRSSSLERDSVLLAAGLVSHGLDVHCYCDPAARTAQVTGVTFHDVSGIRPRAVSLGSRFAHPLERASFAVAATRALRQDRQLYDLIDVRQTGAWEHDVVTVHGVVAALQKRWPAETGRAFRAARPRAAIAPLARPQIALDRTIQALQLRRKRFRRVIAVTEQVRDDLVNVHGVPVGLIDVIPPPIDLERFNEAKPSGIRRALRIPENETLVLFVGHGFQRKGLDKLIEALAGVPQTHLVVVGEGDRSRLMRSLDHDGLVKRVHFVGRIDEPERYYVEADLLALPSRTEPWGIPLIEAMAFGVPVIGTSIAGAANVVTKADAGIIVSDDSTAALRAAIDTLVRNPELRRRMGERGRVAAASFGAKSHAGAALETYERALRDANPDRDRFVVP
jgi:UDP-glucose:(heptosyl)LPS alpha-1,3-glucosyltransferase